VLNKSLGYIGELFDMNAHNAILTLRKDFDVKNNDFFVLHLWTFKMPILVFIIFVFSYFIFLYIIFLSIICSI